MGVPGERLTLGGLPGGFLRRDLRAAVVLLGAVLERTRPSHVFVTIEHDGQHDHDAAWDAVRRAVRESGLRPVILGYPIWAWRQWPWVAASPFVFHRRAPAGGGVETAARPYSRFLGGLRLIAALNVRVDVSSALDHKRAALAEHRSQVERRDGNPDWRILADVADGEFLERLFGPGEYFRLVRP
jgi:LmbE family N-acetylglucosaminyl deacetylase